MNQDIERDPTRTDDRVTGQGFHMPGGKTRDDNLEGALEGLGTLIAQEIDHKREGAMQKIDEIEERVEGSMHQTQEGAEQTITNVQDRFDLRKQIEERPLVALGVALVGGFILGGMMSGDEEGGQRRVEGQRMPSGSSSQGGIKQGIRTAAKRSGLDETMNNMAAAAMGAMTERIKSVADQNLPGFSAKLQTAKGSGGSFSEKSHATQETVHD